MRRMIVVAAAIALLAVMGSAQVEAQVACSQSAPSCGGGTFTGGTLTSPLLLPDGDAAAPSLRWSGSTPDGWFYTSNVNSSGSPGILWRNADGQSFAIGFSGSDRTATLLFNSYVGSNTFFQTSTPNQNGFTAAESNGTARYIFGNRGIYGALSKTLVDASATQFVRVSIPQTAGANYAGGNIQYTVMARKGSDIQVLTGNAQFACINNAGTESCAAIVETDKTAAVVTVGTLTCAITAVTGLTDEIALAANCDTSLTATLDGFTIQYRLDQLQGTTVTPQ